MSVELFDPLTKPTAAQLNAIGSSQTALDAVYPGVASVVPAEEFGSAGSAYGFVHIHRWLLYNSTGELVDPTGVNDPSALSDPDDPSTIGILDLNTIDWLTVGVFYRVTGVAVAWEQAEPPSA